MKRSIVLSAIMALFCFSASSLKAQITLPYNTGFDSATEVAGWTEYDTYTNAFSYWSTGGTTGIGGTAQLSHDYAPSTGTALVDDWFVSPEFAIPNGGKLDSVQVKNSGLSTPAAGDTLAIYLLNGSQDPAMATEVTLLYDFRDTAYNADFEWHRLVDIDLPASSGSSYLAFRYRSNDVSSQWLTIGIDNVAISANPNVGQEELEAGNMHVYPNPSNGKFRIETENDIRNIHVYNTIGEVVYSGSNFVSGTAIEIDLSAFPKGIYLLSADQSTHKIVIR